VERGYLFEGEPESQGLKDAEAQKWTVEIDYVGQSVTIVRDENTEIMTVVLGKVRHGACRNTALIRLAAELMMALTNPD
jgi:hypothetical protein